jgi:hypothetical protein
MRSSCRWKTIGVLATILAGGVPSYGTPAIVSFTDAALFGSEDNSLGFEFLVNSNISVSALGYYDVSGLNSTHAVGIFDSSENLLASVMVGPGASVIGNFGYTNLGSSVNLVAGQDYYIAGTTLGNDNWVYQADNIVTDPSISYVESFFVSGTGGVLAFPANDASGRQYMEVNFLVSSSVPEPGSFVLIGLGLGGGWLLRRRRLNQRLIF